MAPYPRYSNIQAESLISRLLKTWTRNARFLPDEIVKMIVRLLRLRVTDVGYRRERGQAGLTRRMSVPRFLRMNALSMPKIDWQQASDYAATEGRAMVPEDGERYGLIRENRSNWVVNMFGGTYPNKPYYGPGF